MLVDRFHRYEDIHDSGDRCYLFAQEECTGILFPTTAKIRDGKSNMNLPHLRPFLVHDS